MVELKNINMHVGKSIKNSIGNYITLNISVMISNDVSKYFSSKQKLILRSITLTPLSTLTNNEYEYR